MRYLMVLLVLLAGCGEYDGPEVEQTMYGVAVTDNVPYCSESNQDIIDREDLPPQDDRVTPDHRI